MTNLEVIERWANGKSGEAGTLHTNGNVLKSYAQVIGYTNSDHQKVVIGTDTAGVTTKRHINAARKVCNVFQQHNMSLGRHTSNCHYPCQHTPNAIEA